MKLTKQKVLSILTVASLTLSGISQASLYDRGEGLIYDDVLDVTWLKDANYAKTSGHDADGRMTWSIIAVSIIVLLMMEVLTEDII